MKRSIGRVQHFEVGPFLRIEALGFENLGEASRFAGKAPIEPPIGDGIDV
jgi:hypothetical protein